MELANHNSQKEVLLSAVTPDILGIIWAYEKHSDVSDVYSSLNYLSHGILEQQRHSLFESEHTLLTMSQYGRPFYLVILEQKTDGFYQTMESTLGIIHKQCHNTNDSRTKLLSIGFQDSKKIRSKYNFDFISLKDMT